MGRLEGKVAIVTGAASGIGRASALAFAREGAKVVVVDREAAGIARTAKAIGDAGGAALGLAADIAVESEVARYVALAVETYGGLDVVYANAGISGGLTPLLEQSAELWAEVLRVNLIGPFLAIKHAAPVMTARGGGSIVLTASVAGLRASAGGSAYAASKAGVVSLAQTASHALTGTGVRVNAICPGLIETGMTKPLFDHARARGTDGKIGQLNPLRRPGAPDEIAAMALFLASDESSYVNGQAFAVDGGLSSSHPFTQPWR
jgi:NAD(P)-dependent dehydrogenase (short-subunit alcohol dehydrogenase family)